RTDGSLPDFRQVEQPPRALGRTARRPLPVGFEGTRFRTDRAATRCPCPRRRLQRQGELSKAGPICLGKVDPSYNILPCPDNTCRRRTIKAEAAGDTGARFLPPSPQGEDRSSLGGRLDPIWHHRAARANQRELRSPPGYEDRMQIGIAGVGRMGAAIANRLMEIGHQLTVTNRTRSKLPALREAGAQIADSPAELARNV